MSDRGGDNSGDGSGHRRGDGSGDSDRGGNRPGDREGVEPGVLPERRKRPGEAAEQAALTEEPVGESGKRWPRSRRDRPVTGLEEAQEVKRRRKRGRPGGNGTGNHCAHHGSHRAGGDGTGDGGANCPTNSGGGGWISYPDQEGKWLPPVLLVWLPGAESVPGEAGEEEASLSQQITPPVCGLRWCMRRFTPVWDFQYELYSYHIRRPFW